MTEPGCAHAHLHTGFPAAMHSRSAAGVSGPKQNKRRGELYLWEATKTRQIWCRVPKPGRRLTCEHSPRLDAVSFGARPSFLRLRVSWSVRERASRRWCDWRTLASYANTDPPGQFAWRMLKTSAPRMTVVASSIFWRPPSKGVPFPQTVRFCLCARSTLRSATTGISLRTVES